MDFTKKQSALLYLDANGFYFFETGLPNILSLPFAETSVRTMDVINTVSLEEQIKAFIQQYNLKPAIISVILSPNITFEKELIDIKPEEKDETIKKFIDTVPFDTVLSRTYPIEKGVKVIGCNAELFYELKKSFEKNYFGMEIIVPYQMIGIDQALIQNLIPENAAMLLRHIDRFKPLSMAISDKVKPHPTQSVQPTTQTPQTPQKPNRMRLYVMGGVFGILILVMVFMLLNMK